VTQGKEHTWLIGISVAVNVIMIVAMVASVKIFYFPRRSRILARHARRTTFTDVSSFINLNDIRETLGTIKEPVLWIDVSMARIWYSFIFCLVVIGFFQFFAIICVAVEYNVVGIVFTTIFPVAVTCLFIFYYTTDKGQYAKINILSQRGAYVIYVPGIQAPVFTPFSAMVNVAVSDSRGGVGSVTFSGGGKSATGFRDIPAPHNALRIINEQIDILPQFAQPPSSARVVQMTSATESAPLLSGNSPNVF
jgi:hypothetical protein